MREADQADQEVFESIPWEELRDLGEGSRRRRIWFLVGGAALAAMIVFSVARTFSDPDPLLASDAILPTTAEPAMPPSPSASAVVADPPLVAPATTVPNLPSEADLMANTDPAPGEESPPKWQAAAFAEWFALEFFTRGGPEQPQRWGWLGDGSSDRATEAISQVEWAGALRVESLGDGRWRAEVAIRRLVSADGAGLSRLPTQAVEVVVDMETGVPTVVDLPRFIPLPDADPGQWWLGEPREAPPPAVIRTAREQLLRSGAGTPAGEPRISRTKDAWRVEWAMDDQAGIRWPVSLWIGPEGMPVPAGGRASELRSGESSPSERR